MILKSETYHFRVTGDRSWAESVAGKLDNNVCKHDEDRERIDRTRGHSLSASATMCVLCDHCSASSESRSATRDQCFRITSLHAQVEINNGAAAIAGDQQAGRGMDTRRLQHYLGHASITNTVRYTAMSPEPVKDIWR
jgi:hypothetical protein